MTYADALVALADPTRRRILDELRVGPKPVGVIAAKLPVSRSAHQAVSVFRACSGFRTSARPAANSRPGFALRAFPVRVHDDLALGRLAEHLGQAHHRHGPTRDHVREHLAGTDRGQLVDVPDQEDAVEATNALRALLEFEGSLLTERH